MGEEEERWEISVLLSGLTFDEACEITEDVVAYVIAKYPGHGAVGGTQPWDEEA
jgi:hypothetical protein